MLRALEMAKVKVRSLATPVITVPLRQEQMTENKVPGLTRNWAMA